MSATSYHYYFPYDAPANLSRDYGIHDLYFNDPNIPFIILKSDKELSESQAYEKLSISLALLSLFEKEGFLARPVSAIGGYNCQKQNAPYKATKHSAEINEITKNLYMSNDSFQIQSRFTLSRAHALFRDPESSITEFFKIIELFIKYCASTGVFSEKASRDVLARSPKLFTDEVKKELVEKEMLQSKTVEVIFKLKNIRNRFMVHGGVRPVVAGLFGDPEDNKTGIKFSEFQYDNEYIFGEPFYEKVMYDLEIIAVILFCKLNNIKPIYSSVPGCWWQSSEVIANIIVDEGVETFEFYPSKLE